MIHHGRLDIYTRSILAQSLQLQLDMEMFTLYIIISLLQ
jgi:hypothetical protein